MAPTSPLSGPSLFPLIGGRNMVCTGILLYSSIAVGLCLKIVTAVKGCARGGVVSCATCTTGYYYTALSYHLHAAADDDTAVLLLFRAIELTAAVE